MPGSERRHWLARLFWIVACADALLVLAALAKVLSGSPSRYDVLVALILLAILGLVGVIAGVVALIRRGVAYGIGLALLAASPLMFGAQYAIDLATSPSASALQAGHGYFTRPADRALADAIVARDGAKVASLAPAANTNAIGWDNMTFMRLALKNGDADPDIVAALLRAGASPEQDSQLLFGFMTESDADVGVMIKDRNERLLRAVLDAGVDLNHPDLEGYPRFFSGLKWPEGLALMLGHGADPEAEGKDGDTAIMWAVMLRYWPAIDVLLAHGARTDHVAHDGKSLRDVVAEMRGRQQGDIPPQLAALEARLR
jgi:hypothetical protein